MATLYWVPDSILNIEDPTEGRVRCAASSTSSRNGRCCINREWSSTLSDLLGDMATLTPSEVSRVDLKRIAAQCLCQKHENQASNVIEQWEESLRVAGIFYDMLEEAEENNEELQDRIGQLEADRNKIAVKLGTHRDRRASDYDLELILKRVEELVRKEAGYSSAKTNERDWKDLARELADHATVVQQRKEQSIKSLKDQLQTQRDEKAKQLSGEREYTSALKTQLEESKQANSILENCVDTKDVQLSQERSKKILHLVQFFLQTAKLKACKRHTEDIDKQLSASKAENASVTVQLEESQRRCQQQREEIDALRDQLSRLWGRGFQGWVVKVWTNVCGWAIHTRHIVMSWRYSLYSRLDSRKNMSAADVETGLQELD